MTINDEIKTIHKIIENMNLIEELLPEEHKHLVSDVYTDFLSISNEFYIVKEDALVCEGSEEKR